MDIKRDTYDDIFDAENLKQMNVIGTQISEARRRMHLTSSELSEKLKLYNISVTPSAIRKWESGVSVPNGYQLLAVCKILSIQDVLQVFTATKVHPPSKDLNRKGQNILDAVRRALIASGEYPPRGREHSDRMVQLHVFNQAAAAGSGNFIDDASDEVIDYPENAVPDGTDFGVRISGNSMLPLYVNGQIAMVRQCQELYPGQIGVFMYDGNAFIKKYTELEPEPSELDDYTDSYGCVHKKIILVSLNPEYDNIEIKPHIPFSIVGQVLN